MTVENKSIQWVENSTNTDHTATKKPVKINQSTHADTSVMIKQVFENLKIFRRHSFDDNGGGYAGL